MPSYLLWMEDGSAAGLNMGGGWQVVARQLFGPKVERRRRRRRRRCRCIVIPKYEEVLGAGVESSEWRCGLCTSTLTSQYLLSNGGIRVGPRGR